MVVIKAYKCIHKPTTKLLEPQIAGENFQHGSSYQSRFIVQWHCKSWMHIYMHDSSELCGTWLVNSMGFGASVCILHHLCLKGGCLGGVFRNHWTSTFAAGFLYTQDWHPHSIFTWISKLSLWHPTQNKKTPVNSEVLHTLYPPILPMIPIAR